MAENIIAKPNKKLLGANNQMTSGNRETSFISSLPGDDSTKNGSVQEAPSSIYGLQDFSKLTLSAAQDITAGQTADHSLFSFASERPVKANEEHKARQKISSQPFGIMMRRWKRKMEKSLPLIDLNDLMAEIDEAPSDKRQTAPEFS